VIHAFCALLKRQQVSQEYLKFFYDKAKCQQRNACPRPGQKGSLICHVRPLPRHKYSVIIHDSGRLRLYAFIVMETFRNLVPKIQFPPPKIAFSNHWN
jgi:hypothetical protein